MSKGFIGLKYPIITCFDMSRPEKHDAFRIIAHSRKLNICVRLLTRPYRSALTYGHDNRSVSVPTESVRPVVSHNRLLCVPLVKGRLVLAEANGRSLDPVT